MTLELFLILLSGILMLLLIVMFVAFLTRELFFARQLDSIRDALIVNANIAKETVALVNSSIKIVEEVKTVECESVKHYIEELKDVIQVGRESQGRIIRIEAMLLARTEHGSVNHNTYLATTDGSQVNQGSIKNPENR